MARTASGSAVLHPGGMSTCHLSVRHLAAHTGDDFVGRTNFRFTLPARRRRHGRRTGSTDGKVAVLKLDTFNPQRGLWSFLGSDVITSETLRRRRPADGHADAGGERHSRRNGGGTISVRRSRNVANPTPPPATIPVRDEIDHEIITNNAQSAAPDNTLTNVWNDGNFARPGAPVTISNPAGFDVTQFHDYRTDWTPTSVKWYIDDTLVRTENYRSSGRPDAGSCNFWAPDTTFAAAYNAGAGAVGDRARHAVSGGSRSVQIERSIPR